MEEVDWTKVSEATKAEMEAGRKQLAENQARFEQAIKRRNEEENPEIKQTTDEAKPLEKEGFPVAGRKVKAEAKGGGA